MKKKLIKEGEEKWGKLGKGKIYKEEKIRKEEENVERREREGNMRK